MARLKACRLASVFFVCLLVLLLASYLVRYDTVGLFCYSSLLLEEGADNDDDNGVDTFSFGRKETCPRATEVHVRAAHRQE